MIHETTKYDSFKIIDKNRRINESNLKRLINSIKFNNLLQRRPIEVNENMEVLDGQHRLEACRRLSLTVYYEIKPHMTIEDICLLGTNQRHWRNEDYLNLHENSGRPDYLRLSQFMKKNKLPLSNVLALTGLTGRDNFFLKFKMGEFTFSEEELRAAQDKFDKSKVILDYLRPKLLNMDRFITASRFQRCLFILLSHQEFDLDVFLKNLGSKMELIRPASRLEDILECLQKIYNFRSKSEISLSL